MNPANDPSLVAQQYATPDHLDVRQRTHLLYGETPFDLPQAVLDQIHWRGDEWAVDVGAGTGLYAAPARARAARYLAADLSFGMLTGLEPGVWRVNLDAAHLPLAAHSVDVLLANHMLYHVPNQTVALRAFSRVLKPGGVLLAATNSENNMDQLHTLVQSVLFDLCGADAPISWLAAPTRTFSLENGGARLETHFRQVGRSDFSSDLVFPAPEPVIAYVGSSLQAWVEQFRPNQLAWPAVADALHHRLSRHLHAHGVFRVTRRAGVFVCRQPIQS